MSGVLIAHRGSIRIAKEELINIEAPSPTKSWRPIQHGVLVNTLSKALSTKGLAVK